MLIFRVGADDAGVLAKQLAADIPQPRDLMKLPNHEMFVRLMLHGSPTKRAEIIDELADVTCYILGLANALELDLSTAVREKLAKNARKYPTDQFRGRYFKPGE